MSSPAPAPIRYRFAEYELNASAHTLTKRGLRVKLQPIPFQALALFLERPGELITREELQHRLWQPGTFVDFDQGLNVAIKKLRDALGEVAGSSRYIETVAGEGYRWIADVQTIACNGIPGHLGATASPLTLPVGETSLSEVSESVETNRHATTEVPFLARHRRLWSALSVAILCALGLGIFALGLKRGHSMQIHSLAVLPLRNLSADPNQEYFADGITEDLITSLAQSLRLRVISHTSVMRYKQTAEPITQIAKELGADAIIEGAVARDGDRVTVTVQLINAIEDRHLWAQKYDRRLGELLDIETEVSKQIASQIGVTLSNGQEFGPTKSHNVDPQAHDLYLNGRYFWNKRTRDGMRRAAEYFQQAVNLDPNYAPAYVGLADCYLFGQPTTEPPKVLGLKAKAMLNKALELDPSLGEAHASLALTAQNIEWDWAEAGRQYQRAIELSPNYATAHQWYAEYLTISGNFGEAMNQMKIARELDPLSLIIVKDSGEIYYVARNYKPAIEYFRKALEFDPTFPGARRYLAMAYIQTGELSSAVSELKRAFDEENEPDTLAELGFAYAVANRREEARKALTELNAMSKQRYVSPRDYALIYAGLGDKDQAFAWLERAYREGAVLVGLSIDPLWDSLRSDRRFADLMKRMGLPF